MVVQFCSEGPYIDYLLDCEKWPFYRPDDDGFAPSAGAGFKPHEILRFTSYKRSVAPTDNGTIVQVAVLIREIGSLDDKQRN